MKNLVFVLLGMTILAGCVRKGGEPAVKPGAARQEVGVEQQTVTLAEARKGFVTKLVRQESAKEPIPVPPANLFRVVHYDAPCGKLAAYISTEKKDGKKHPAIIWITGGDSNTIDSVCWLPAPADNDQSASAFRDKGIVMMFPSLRGGNDNPGFKEGFFGEVEDVLAAAEFLSKQPDVDPEHVYLGGHSTGGTLVLLTADYPNHFRAVFSFGPVHSITRYPSQFLPFDVKNQRELELRSPFLWLATIKTPVFVFEGTNEGNIGALELMAKISKNPMLHFYPVQRASHFSILSPTTRYIAEQILADQGPATSIEFSAAELNKPFKN
ncbi:MAG TPA: prolyl oligopeptidase family serine peptidase [Gemmataceae bacterium]|jgi:hypothetical protein|nr:prolyl oligopeptidase family serine peptidase [Gemmataceae bacterium]